jgi:hypothetical protein
MQISDAVGGEVFATVRTIKHDSTAMCLTGSRPLASARLAGGHFTTRLSL